MKSCFSPLQGAGLWSAPPQLPRLSLCQTYDVHRGGRRSGRQGRCRNYLKMNYTCGIWCFPQHGKTGTLVRGSVSSYQTPVCFILEIVLPHQLQWKSANCDLCSRRRLLWFHCVSRTSVTHNNSPLFLSAVHWFVMPLRHEILKRE